MLIVIFLGLIAYSQNYKFDFNTSGRRVCLVSSEVNLNANNVKLIFHDSLSNSTEPLYVYKRSLGSQTWTSVACGQLKEKELQETN